MTKKIAISIIAVTFAIISGEARADGRSLMFMRGVAYGIAQECPGLPVDSDGVRRKQRIPATREGDFYDFMDGMIFTSGMLRRREQTCATVCDIRPGTCYFVKEGGQ